jgi:hypothetical protein
MSVAMQQHDEDLRPDPRRSRRVRAALAIAVIAVLAAQSVMAFATPKLARASARPVEGTPWYQSQSPAPAQPGHPGRDAAKDPRTC